MANNKFKKRVRQFFSKFFSQKKLKNAGEWACIIGEMIVFLLVVPLVYIVILIVVDNPLAYLLWGTVIPKIYAKFDIEDCTIFGGKPFKILGAIFSDMENNVFRFLPWFAQRRYIKASYRPLSFWPVKSQVRYFNENPCLSILKDIDKQAKMEVASLDTLPLFTELSIKIDMPTFKKLLQENHLWKENRLTEYFAKITPSEEAIDLLFTRRLFKVIYACVRKHGAYYSNLRKFLGMQEPIVVNEFKQAVYYHQQMQMSLDDYKKYAAKGRKLLRDVIINKLNSESIDFLREIYKNEDKNIWKDQEIELMIDNSSKLTTLFLELGA